MKLINQAIAFLLISTSTTFAQAPVSMNYQGRLVDGKTLLNGTHTVVFRVYSTNVNGQVLFAESDTVDVNDGFYATELGDNPVAPGAYGGKEPYYGDLLSLFANADKVGKYWMELEVDGTTLSPRERILATPFAMVAGEAMSVANNSITGADIASGTITSADIANGTIRAYDLADSVRSTLDSADGSILNAVVLDNDGNMGIGTSEPVAGLQVSTGVDVIDPILRSALLDSGGTFTNLNGCASAAVKGNYAYVASETDSAISVINISNPDNPTLVTTLKDGVNGFDYLGTVYSLVIDGDYLYAGSFADDAVNIIDISTPANPTLATALVNGIAGYNHLDAVGRLCVYNDLLFIPSRGDDAVTIVDVSNPSTPVLQSTLVDGNGSFTNLDGVWSIACEGNYAYLAAHSDYALTIVDISNPSSPQFVADVKDGLGGIYNLGYPYGVAVSGGYVYLAALNDHAVTVIDCRTPASPTLAASITNGQDNFNNLTSPQNVCIDGDRLYISANYGVTVADISDPTSPRPIVELVDGEDGFNSVRGVGQMVVEGDLLYICAKFNDAMTIADISSTGAAGLYVADRVGINTPLPREALDVRGNIIASGDITAGNDLIAKDDVYIESYADGDSGRNVRMESDGRLYASSSKSSYVSVPPCAFKPSNDGSGITAYSYTYAYMASGGSAMLAPVQLPHGADISAVTFYYYDNDAASTLVMSLRRQSIASTSYVTMASGSSSGAPEYDSIADSSISVNIVDNVNYTYFLLIGPSSGSWSSLLRFQGARISYTIDD